MLPTDVRPREQRGRGRGRPRGALSGRGRSRGRGRGEGRGRAAGPGRRPGRAAAAAGPVDPDQLPPDPFKGLLQKDLPPLMYGYGDDANPLPETMQDVEGMVIDFVTDLTHKLMENCGDRKMSHQDLLYLLRKDSKKVSRVLELMKMSEEIKEAKKIVNMDEIPGDANDDF